jgi:hypothetical protein
MGTQFIRRDIAVDAWQVGSGEPIPEGFPVELNAAGNACFKEGDEPRMAFPGNWIVRFADGRLTKMQNEHFEITYQEA